MTYMVTLRVRVKYRAIIFIKSCFILFSEFSLLSGPEDQDRQR